MTSAQSQGVNISDDKRIVRRGRVGQVTVETLLANVVAVLAIGGLIALGASFEAAIDDGAQAEHAAATPSVGSQSEAYELADTGMAIFPYGPADDHEVGALEGIFNVATLPLELASSLENREGWMTGTIEVGYGFAQLVGGGFNLLAQQSGVAGLVGKGITGAANVPATVLFGKRPFDGETGTEMFRAFIGMADFENNGVSGGMGRLGMMMLGSIYNEAMVMGSRNRQNASYALGAWTIDILPWMAAMRPGSHAAQRMGRGAGAIAKWRKAEVAKDASKLAKQGRPNLFQRLTGRFGRSGDEVASTNASAAAAAAAVTATTSSAHAGLVTPQSPAWSAWLRGAGMSPEAARTVPGELSLPDVVLPSGARVALDGQVLPSTPANRAQFQNIAGRAGVQQGPSGVTPVGGRILLPDGSEHAPGLRRTPAIGENAFDDITRSSGVSPGRLLQPGDPGFEQTLRGTR